MERLSRWAWLAVSFVWFVACVVVLFDGGPTRMRQDDGLGRRQTNALVLVMPSPPSVSGPLTRIERLATIQATWGQDLVDSGDNR